MLTHFARFLAVGMACMAVISSHFLFHSVFPWTLKSLKRIKRNLALKNLKFTFAATVTNLTIYPVKSAKGILRSSLFCGRLGISASQTSLLIDRGWLVVVGDQHRFVTQRQEPKLVLISVSFDDTSRMMTLNSPGFETVSFPLPTADAQSHGITRHTSVFGTKTSGQDCGDQAADWLSEFLDKPGHRLIYKAPDQFTKERDLAETIPYSDIDGRDGLKYRTIAYQDDAPVLVANQASLSSLNKKLDRKIGMTRFRPNVTVGGAGAWEEDEWEYVVICPPGLDPNQTNWSDSRVVALRRVSPSTRCKVPTVDPETGVMDKEEEPLRTMKEFRLWESVIGKLKKHEALRAKTVFGGFFGIVEEGEIREGDALWVVKE